MIIYFTKELRVSFDLSPNLTFFILKLKKVHIGIIKERKIPRDNRAPFTPGQINYLMKTYPELAVSIEPDDERCFRDEDYKKAGAIISNDLRKCDVIFGVKEIPSDYLFNNKQYFFFSHTIKGQSYNMPMLRNILKRGIHLIDYELLTNNSGKRLVAFGRYAGLVGAYNALWTYGKKSGVYMLPRAFESGSILAMFEIVKEIKLPALKFLVTGTGRVASGAAEILEQAGVQKVSRKSYLSDNKMNAPVYLQLGMKDYHKSKNGDEFNYQDFYADPSSFSSTFHQYIPHTDVLITGAYWDPKAPVLFTREDMLKQDFNIGIIADITCDIRGSVPSTIRASSIENPVYDYDPSNDQEKPAFTGQYSVMAIDNLPNEIPADASTGFGEALSKKVFPELFKKESELIRRASIAKGGELMPAFSYLGKYLENQ